MTIVPISDTHLRRFKIPDGDILVHSGDLTFRGTVEEIKDAMNKLDDSGATKFKHKLLTPGNHDWLFERSLPLAEEICREYGWQVLHEKSLNVEGIKFYGSAWQPAFCNWAFNIPRGEALREIWARIPSDTDYLVTHTPPYGILDEVMAFSPGSGEWETEHVGCEELYKVVIKVKPKIHQFGHIHGSSGEKQFMGIHFVNASICDEGYKASNPPRRLIWSNYV